MESSVAIYRRPARADGEERDKRTAPRRCRGRRSWRARRDSNSSGSLQVNDLKIALVRNVPGLGTFWYAGYAYPTGYRRKKAVTHCSCSGVSGTLIPRALLINSNALRGSIPNFVSTHAASKPDLPIPARQWIATLAPDRTFAARTSTSFAVAGTEAGTPRSRTGKETNSISEATQSVASSSSSSSCDSLGSSSDTTTSTPSLRHPTISSTNQSPARGLAMIARRPLSTGIQYSSGLMNSCVSLKRTLCMAVSSESYCSLAAQATGKDR